MTLFGEDQQPLLWLTGCGLPGQQGRGAGHQEAPTAGRPSSSWQGGALGLIRTDDGMEHVKFAVLNSSLWTGRQIS